jgi:hypothetical protein
MELALLMSPGAAAIISDSSGLPPNPTERADTNRAQAPEKQFG